MSIDYSKFSIDERVVVDLDTMVEDVDLDGDGFGSLGGFRLLDGALLVYAGSSGHTAVVALSVLVIGPTTLGFLLGPRKWALWDSKEIHPYMCILLY